MRQRERAKPELLHHVVMVSLITVRMMAITATNERTNEPTNRCCIKNGGPKEAKQPYSFVFECCSIASAEITNGVGYAVQQYFIDL